MTRFRHQHSSDEERALWEAFTRGEREAFSGVYTRYADALLSYGTGLGFDRETLKDAIHDTFYRLYARPSLLGGVREVKPYLFRALRNHLINSRKSGNREVGIDSRDFEFSINVSVVDELIEEEERARVAREIERYLAELTARQREAIYLRFVQEFDYEEIAALLNLSPHGARKLISRAIITIRERYPLLAVLFHVI
ncbi:MAG: sigma-70 family RNA polymerase sigma factor [Odoribacteraceae bacterium]|jgi:RNA polymerase sigma factor (sigma-70 family)|nr:sigma-70 family RNA polymerase sigma factor [Odoribacteraceae bacterium]